jgi:hypothetical protein
MAFLDPNNYQIDPNNPQGQQAQQGGSSNALMGDASGGGTVFAGAPPTSNASQGAGGAGGWTNIQNYLQANQGNTGTADKLNKDVGGTFDQEQSNLGNQSSQVKQQAQGAVDKNNVTQDAASKAISQAGSLYNYGGQQSNEYQQALNPIKSSLSAQYQGPTQFSYGLGAQTQQYGSDLGNDQGFHGLMNGLYNQAAGGQMGSGALALQEQLDTNNQAVNDTRSSLAQRYAGLQGLVGSTVADTNTALHGAQSQFGQNQAGLRNYLGTSQQADQGAINNKVGSINDWLNQTAVDSQAGPQNADAFNQLFADAQNRALVQKNGQTVRDANIFNNIMGAEGNSQKVSYSHPEVNASNATGVDTQRNEYNAIADALGLGGYINKTDPYDIANVNRHEIDDNTAFNYNRYDSPQNIGQSIGPAFDNPNETVKDQSLASFLTPGSAEYQQAVDLGILKPSVR